MADFEFAVCVKDEADLKSGHKRMKQGDIIAVKPAGWTWGKKEVDQFLIVPVTGLTKEEAHELCVPQYEEGVLQPEGDMEEGLPVWIKETEYRVAGESSEQTWGADQIRTAQNIHVCIQAGTSGETTPTWATKVVDIKTVDSASETVDGTVKWKCIKKCDVFQLENDTTYVLGDKINVNGSILECIQAGTTSGVDISVDKAFKKETTDGTVKWKSLGKNNPKTVGKRRYSIPLATIKAGWKTDIILADVEDKKKVYQPLKDAKVKIDFSEKVQICKDNSSRKHKYAAKKTASVAG